MGGLASVPAIPCTIRRMPPRRSRCAFICNAGLALALGACIVVTAPRLSAFLTAGESLPGWFPKPLYPVLPVPGTAARAGAHCALGGDFSQVYASGRAVDHGESAYAPASPAYADPLGRLPNYPPLTNHVYAPLSRWPYAQALLAHSLLTLALYLGISGAFLRRFQQAHLLLAHLALTLVLGHLTPVGLSHFERGQFDWLSASATALAFWSLLDERWRPGLCVLAGVLGAMKWTSAPLLGTLALFGLVTSARRRVWFCAIPGVLILSVLLFLPEVREYGRSLEHFELTPKPTDLSYAAHLPRALAKSLQLLVCLSFVGLLCARHRRPAERAAAATLAVLPFGLAMALQGASFTTLATEYRLVSFLGCVPAALVWRRAGALRSDDRALLLGALAMFLIAGFRVVDRRLAIGMEEMPFVYFGFTLLFLALAVRLAWRRPEPAALGPKTAG